MFCYLLRHNIIHFRRPLFCQGFGLAPPYGLSLFTRTLRPPGIVNFDLTHDHLVLCDALINRHFIGSDVSVSEVFKTTTVSFVVRRHLMTTKFRWHRTSLLREELFISYRLNPGFNDFYWREVSWGRKKLYWTVPMALRKKHKNSSLPVGMV